MKSNWTPTALTMTVATITAPNANTQCDRSSKFSVTIKKSRKPNSITSHFTNSSKSPNPHQRFAPVRQLQTTSSPPSSNSNPSTTAPAKHRCPNRICTAISIRCTRPIACIVSKASPPVWEPMANVCRCESHHRNVNRKRPRRWAWSWVASLRVGFLSLCTICWFRFYQERRLAKREWVCWLGWAGWTAPSIRSSMRSTIQTFALHSGDWRSANFAKANRQRTWWCWKRKL